MNAPTKTQRARGITNRLAWGMIALCICATTATQAAPSRKSKESGSAATTPKKSKTVRVKHQQNNSGESTAERDRRLYRECKGRPNAGACLGYTER